MKVDISRYRFFTFEYKDDFDGNFSFGGNKSGYAFKGEDLQIKGWILPNFDTESYQLNLEVIENGRVIKSYPIELLDSPDVASQFKDMSAAVKSRYHLTIDHNLLQNDEYVVRLAYNSQAGRQRKRIKVWDIALISDTCKTPPVFVVGSPRAGTTAIGNSLRIALGAKNYGEHHFIELQKRINQTINEYFTTYHTRSDVGTFIEDISPALVKLKFENNVKDLYSHWNTGNYIVDKTPGRNMLNCIPLLLEIWPESKFIYCKRRAYENVRSRLAKFPNLDIYQHSSQWVETMNTWRKVKKHIPRNNFIELDQQDMRKECSDLKIFLKSFLTDELVNRVIEGLNDIEPQKSNYTDKDNFDSNIVKSICGDEMQLNGYSLDPQKYYD
ncbi:hypothetical protein AVL55_17340 [Alteromonas macleodii]|uniref:Sulfotransferase family protein n=1 Tax=Alteromonas macleodii TaxID=28108 RepID=A0A126Q3D5_ALTMA|nr:sulfotransferase [Alteromonas macleodii]AMJ99762.1 hypothetical protein AVL55_17340 [Alteromonas macleodii]